MSISRNYEQTKIGRPNTLSSGGNLSSDSSPSAQFFRRVEKSVVPAVTTLGKYAVKGIAKTGTATLPVIGQGLGLATGVGVSALTNPELIPYLGTGGAMLGKKGGQYLQTKANKAIDKALA